MNGNMSRADRDRQRTTQSRFVPRKLAALLLLGLLLWGNAAPLAAEPLGAALLGAALLGAEPERSPSSLAPEELVEQLGDPRFAVREQAERELIDRGVDVQPAVQGALKASDAEVRRRARRILGRLLDAEYERRLEAFLADESGTKARDLPGWQRFQAIVGEVPDARQLFAKMHKAEAALLESAEAGVDPAAEVLQWRLDELVKKARVRRGQDVPLGAIATVLFITGDEELPLPAQLLNSRELAILAQGNAIQEALKAAKADGAFRKLAGHWLLQPSGTQLLYAKLRLALQGQLPEGLALGVRALRQKELPGNYRFFGIPIIGQLGGKPHAARLAALLDDPTVVGRRPVKVDNKVEVISIQVRDVALGWLIHVTEQDPGDYHLAHVKSAFAALRKTPNASLNITSVYFHKDAHRDEALSRWRKWVAEHPLPDPPALPASAEAPVLVQGSLVPVQGGVVEVGGDAPSELPPLGGLAAADRLVSRQLDQARRLIQEGQFGEAAQLVGNVLEAPRDYTFFPDRLVPLRRTLKAEARQLLRSMPAVGREAYELQYGTEARNRLESALQAGDYDALEDVARRYGYTQAGKEAAYLLASHHYDQGNPFRAALLLERLQREVPETDSFEPQLSLQLASCWLLAGLPERAAEVLRAARAEFSEVPLRNGERPLPWFTKEDQALAWLQGLLGLQVDHPEFEWPLEGGDLARNRHTADLQPYLKEMPPLTPTSAEPIERSVEALVQKKVERYETRLPSCTPLVLGDLIVTRTATGLHALDRSDGRLLWQAPLDDSLSHVLAGDAEPLEKLGDYLDAGLQRRLWSNPTYGALSSNGRLVFALEGLGFGRRGEQQRMVVMPDGRRRLDPDGMKTYNTLAAYSAKTGKLQWEVGGPMIRDARPLAGTFFLGVPLPVGQQLFAVARRGNRNHLIELDAETGELRWEMVLDDASEQPIRTGINMPAEAPDQDASLREGYSPSSAQGLLVCPTDDGGYVGVDLGGRQVQWVFETPRNYQVPSGQIAFNPFQRRAQADQVLNSSDRWLDSRIVIAGSRVLLTPPLSDRLYCLDLRSGRVIWSKARRDGLYLAGVTVDDVVVIAGRATVWGLRLADGKPAWETPGVGLPPGAVLSGRGYLTERHFHLPLATGEVAVFDIRQGVLESRTRASGDFLPGNLVPCHDAVLSQNAQGLWRLETLEARGLELAKRLAEKPGDAQTLAERGELFLSRGRLDEALTDLRQSWRLEPREQTRQLLIDASLEAVRQAPQRRGELLSDLPELLQSDKERLRYHRLMARLLRRAGEFREALDHYLKVVALPREPDELEFVAAGHQVRKDRWLRAEMDQWLEAAPPEEATALRRRVLDLRGKVDDDQLLRLFGNLPLADEIRLDRAARQQSQQQWLQAELPLRHVFEQGDDAQRQQATARLAELLRQAKRPEEAARFYRLLRDQLPNVEIPTASGDASRVTGARLVERLPKDDPVRPLLQDSDRWPDGKAEVKSETKVTRLQFGFPVTMQASRPLTPRWHVSITSGSSAELIAENTWANRRLQAKLTGDGRRSVSQFAGIGQGRLRGHLFVGWVGDRVIAVDLLAPQAKLLWEHSLQIGSSSRTQAMRLMAMRVRAQAGNQPFPGSSAQPLAVAADCVCFVDDNWLTGVDPLDGSVFWKREGFDSDSDLLTDDQYLYVTPPGQTEARVLRLSDGTDIGTAAVPPLDQRLLAIGGQVLIGEAREERFLLRLLDLREGRTVWEADFEPDTQVGLAREGDELIVVQPEGHVALIDTLSGERRWERQYPEMAACKAVFLLRGQQRYLLFADSDRSQQAAAGNAAGNRILRIAGLPGTVSIHGHMLAVEPERGGKLWSQPLNGHSLRLDHPAEVPVLTMLSRRQTTGRVRRIQSELHCWDMRNGDVLHESVQTTSNNLYELEAEPDKGQFHVRTYRSSLTVTFAAKAAETQPRE